MMRCVSCSMYALSFVYAVGKGYRLYTHFTLSNIKSLENFTAACLHQGAYAANAGGTVREGDHQGEVTQWIDADQAMAVFHEGPDDAATGNLVAECFRCAHAVGHNGPHPLHLRYTG